MGVFLTCKIREGYLRRARPPASTGPGGPNGLAKRRDSRTRCVLRTLRAWGEGDINARDG